MRWDVSEDRRESRVAWEGTEGVGVAEREARRVAASAAERGAGALVGAWDERRRSRRAFRSSPCIALDRRGPWAGESRRPSLLSSYSVGYCLFPVFHGMTLI